MFGSLDSFRNLRGRPSCRPLHDAHQACVFRRYRGLGRIFLFATRASSELRPRCPQIVESAMLRIVTACTGCKAQAIVMPLPSTEGRTMGTPCPYLKPPCATQEMDDKHPASYLQPFPAVGDLCMLPCLELAPSREPSRPRSSRGGCL